MICPKCQRVHSGICGIPAGVTLGFGARVGGTSQSVTTPKVSKPKGKPATQPLVLEGLLKQAQDWKHRLDEVLKVLPLDSPEITQLLDRESKLDSAIKQLSNQIAGLYFLPEKEQ